MADNDKVYVCGELTGTNSFGGRTPVKRFMATPDWYIIDQDNPAFSGEWTNYCAPRTSGRYVIEE